jgi:hypothetical protein
MKALALVVFSALLSLLLMTGCSGDGKETKSVEPASVTQPPQDVKPKMIDKKPVGFQ